MGNSQSMNNLSMIDHGRRQNTEFLRYSQIPYERPPPQLSHVSLREINGISNLPKPIKVLPDVNNLPKLRSTNNGAILQTCGTITARKDSECGLHRSKSISETNPDDLFAIPSHFKMQRASTQLSITHTSRAKENKIAESKIGNNQVVKSPLPVQPVAAAAKKSQFAAAERNSSRFMERKMFGDTLKKQHQEMEMRQSQMRPQLRREKTFDMTLIHTTTTHNEREKFTPKFSPQIQQKRTKTTTDERNAKSTHASAIKYDRPSDEKMKTIDRKFMERKKGLASTKTTTTTATSNNNNSSNNSGSGFVNKNANAKEVISKRVSPIVTKPQSIPKVSLSPSKKVEPLKESRSNNISNSDSVKITQMIEKNQSQTDNVVRKFAEEVTKMSSADSRQIEVQNENEIDSEGTNILISLRPTLPRRQLQIPHFSPMIAWKSLSTDVNDEHTLTEAQHLMSGSGVADDLGIEKKIEKVYIEPSFNLPFTDNKSGDSGISADKEIGNSAEMLQSSMPSAYMIPSWTPQQDLEDDDSSDQQEPESESFPQPGSLSESNQASFKGSMFSFSLPRDQCIEKIDCNNFYSLQKFKKADIFDSTTNLNESQYPSNSAADNNWLLSSQVNASCGKINESSVEKQRSQIISQMRNGRHVMYLPNSRSSPNEVKVSRNSSMEKEYYEPEHVESNNISNNSNNVRSPSSKNHKFKFQSTIRVTERKKMADMLSREAEEKEMQRLCELEAMKKVEEEFQKKRLREKNRLRQQLRITSLESQHFENPRFSERRSNDTQTPYISRIVEAKSARRH